MNHLNTTGAYFIIRLHVVHIDSADGLNPLASKNRYSGYLRGGKPAKVQLHIKLGSHRSWVALTNHSRLWIRLSASIIMALLSTSIASPQPLYRLFITDVFSGRLQLHPLAIGCQSGHQKNQSHPLYYKTSANHSQGHGAGHHPHSQCPPQTPPSLRIEFTSITKWQ